MSDTFTLFIIGLPVVLAIGFLGLMLGHKIGYEKKANLIRQDSFEEGKQKGYHEGKRLGDGEGYKRALIDIRDSLNRQIGEEDG